MDDSNSGAWQHYSTTTAKRKRADLVCFACHAKKVKCDLQQQRNDGNEACKSCSAVGRACHVRPSKREKKRKVSKDGAGSQNEQSANTMTNGVDALLAADATFNAFTDGQLPQDSGTPHESIQSVRLSSSSFSLQPAQSRNFGTNVSPQGMFQAISVSGESPTLQREHIATSLTNTTPTQNGDVDTGFLQVYAQENQFDAENQALVAQLEHRYCSDLRPDLEQIFTDTYFDYCYTWCPVLDRGSLVSDIASSPLLANALALASSHIQPPLLPHDGPEIYYKRARTIFYDDEEADEMMTLKALCLFYWWAPQSPSRVHRHSYVTPRYISRS